MLWDNNYIFFCEDFEGKSIVQDINGKTFSVSSLLECIEKWIKMDIF